MDRRLKNREGHFHHVTFSRGSNGGSEPRGTWHKPIAHAIFSAEFWCCKRYLKLARIIAEESLKTLNMIDDWLIDRVFQPFQNWFQKLTGRDCFFLAYSAVFVFLCADLGHDFMEKRSSFLFTGTITLFIVLAVFVVIADQAYKAKSGNANVCCLNSARVEWLNSLFRKVMLSIQLFFSPILLIVILEPSLHHLCFGVGCVAPIFALYFAACTPLPKRPSKIGQWLSQLRAGIRQVFSPTPAW